MPLTIEEIRAAAALRPPYEDVSVPDWPGQVRLKRIGAVEGMALGRAFNAMPKIDGSPTDESLVEFYVMVVMACAVDGEGKPLFTEADRAIVSDIAVISALGPTACKLNGYGSDLEKNSPSAPTTNSSSN